MDIKSTRKIESQLSNYIDNKKIPNISLLNTNQKPNNRLLYDSQQFD